MGVRSAVIGRRGHHHGRDQGTRTERYRRHRGETGDEYSDRELQSIDSPKFDPRRRALATEKRGAHPAIADEVGHEHDRRTERDEAEVLGHQEPREDDVAGEPDRLDQCAAADEDGRAGRSALADVLPAERRLRAGGLWFHTHTTRCPGPDLREVSWARVNPDRRSPLDCHDHERRQSRFGGHPRRAR